MIEVDDRELDAMLADDPGGPVVMLNLLRFRPDGGRESYRRYVAAGQDEAMGRTILTLYRSAAQAGAPGLGLPLERAAARPGLAILATADHVSGTEEQRRRAAARAGARVAVLEGLGHWWMTEDPARGAEVLTEFWTGL